MELQPLKIHFFPKLRAAGTDTYTLYMRMVLSGKRADLSLGYELKLSEWDKKAQTLKGKHPKRSHVLNMTNKYNQNAQEVYQQLIQRGMAYDVNIITEKISGADKKSTSLEPSLFKQFNRIIERKKTLAGNNNTKATIQKYAICKKHLINFIAHYYKTDDIKFCHINLQFIEDFEVYLKTNGNCCHNSTMKHIQTFKTIYKAAIAHGYTDKDPFQQYKIRMEEVTRCYLSEQEIQKLILLNIPNNKLSNVRDMFLFCSFTGLAYIDLKNLKSKHITEENGKYWIRTRRQKTNIKTNVPLLDLPLKLIYKHCPEVLDMYSEDRIFKVISNQKMNSYLKEIADLSGIKKELTFHIARHTFATTVTLNNGVPIESVSSMLGHKHITTTQHYAKLLDKKLDEDMMILSGKLSFKTEAEIQQGLC